MADEEKPAPPDHARCVSSTRSGARCRRKRVRGATVCLGHGGAAPQVRARAAEAEARRLFGRLADHATPVADPFAALSQLAGEVMAWKDFCAGRIADLAELSSQTAEGAEQIDAEVALFERALDRCVSTLGLIAKLDIDARLARITEVQAETVRRAVEAGLVAAGVNDPAEVAAARTAVVRELRRTS